MRGVILILIEDANEASKGDGNANQDQLETLLTSSHEAVDLPHPRPKQSTPLISHSMASLDLFLAHRMACIYVLCF
jgi:hypothetical protein